ncbi:60S ribosomal protein L18a [Linum perenne]
MGTETVPASLSDPKTTVQSKDVPYCLDPNLQARLYLPKQVEPGQKLPLLVYYHGGGFVIETAFSPTYHNHLNILVAEANVIAVSVDYRRAPECPIPIPYEDCWAALKWAGSHAGGSGPEEWLNEHADFGSVFLAGDSAGANIVHHVAMRFGQEEIEGIPQLGGLVMIHPYFAGNEPVGKEELRPKAILISLRRIWFLTGAQYHQYQVVGRALPTEADEHPKIYRMKLWHTNEVRAKSKFWYFLRKLKKVKKSNGQMLAINEIFEKNPTKIKNYGIWLRYQSRTGYHNMYKEFRDTTLNGAVEQMYDEMASRHRVRSPCIQIIKTATIPAKLCKRESTKQFHNSKIKFPLVFKKVRPPTRKLKTTYKASRPNLFV